MDEKRGNRREAGTGGRRVMKTTTEYDWNALDRRAEEERAARRKTNVKSSGADELRQKVRYQKQQKQQRLKIKRRRTVFAVAAAAVIVAALLLLTPVFNIRSVSVEGNRLVSAEQFQEKLKPLVGENLFRTGGGRIRRTLKEIPYIESVEVQKKLFPPSVRVSVTEYSPAAVIRVEGKDLVVNSELRVLSEEGTEYSVPMVTGIDVSSYKTGDILKIDDAEKTSIVTTALSTLEAVEIIDRVVEINTGDIANITMNYDNRLTIVCGTQLDLEHKLRLLRETVNALDENARGTIDLSEPGRAIHDPE